MDIEQTAFVLHSRPYRETSALVTFFTPEYGKINGVVRGVRGGRKSTSIKAASIQPFQKLNLSWRQKNNSSSDLISIKAFEALPLRFPLQSESNICGLYLNELLYRLLFPYVSNEHLFEHYQHALYELLAAENRQQQAWCLRKFEAQLLNEMGQPLITEYDSYNEKIEAQLEYFYYPQIGAISSAVDKTRSGIKIKGACLQAIGKEDFVEPCLTELKRLNRTLLAEFLGDKPIKTRELFTRF